MASVANVSDLPYHLPTDTIGQAKALASILEVSPEDAVRSGQDGVQAMTATILYRHMDRHERLKAMQLIQSLPDKSFSSKLVLMAVETTLVNPQWGLWSLTNEELAADIRFHAAVDRVASVSGLALSLGSGKTVKDIIKDLAQERRLNHRGVALLVIGVAFAANKGSLEAGTAEQRRRPQVKGSPYFE